MESDWNLVGKARTDFADMFDGLSDQQLKAATLCDQWTPLEIAGHLVSFVEMSLPVMMLSMAKAGFNSDKAWIANATKYSEMGPTEISRSLRANATKTAPIKSFPAGVSVVDVAIHTQDIRRPLNLDGSLNPDVVRAGLDFCTSAKQGKIHVDPTHIAGLRLEATDLDWSWGTGAEVRGTGEAILMAINRRDTKAELEGDGVKLLG